MIHDVTLYVGTRNRPHFIRRLLNFYHRLGWPFPILIADSSDDLPHAEVKAAIHSYDTDVVTLLDMRHHVINGRSNIHKVFRESLDYCATKLVLPCADDDFRFPSGVQVARDALIANGQAEAAMGRAYGFMVTGIDGVHGHIVNFSPIKYNEAGLSSDDCVTRFLSYLTTPNAIMALMTRDLAVCVLDRARAEVEYLDDELWENLCILNVTPIITVSETMTAFQFNFQSQNGAPTKPAINGLCNPQFFGALQSRLDSLGLLIGDRREEVRQAIMLNFIQKIVVQDYYRHELPVINASLQSNEGVLFSDSLHFNHSDEMRVFFEVITESSSEDAKLRLQMSSLRES